MRCLSKKKKQNKTVLYPWYYRDIVKIGKWQQGGFKISKSCVYKKDINMIKRRWVTLMMMDDIIFYKRNDDVRALADKRKWFWKNLQYGQKQQKGNSQT